MASTYDSVVDGVHALWTASGGRVVAHFPSASAPFAAPSSIDLNDVKPDAEPDDASEVPALSTDEMEYLMQQTHDDAHPLMPHAPVLVGAASCADVQLRWRSVETDAAWPIHGYVVERFPDARHTLAWTTLVDATNASESIDPNVRTSQQYLYRVHAISGTARSPFAYHAVRMNQTACSPHHSLLAYLPSSFRVVPFLDVLSMEAVQTFVLIISCFLAVFGVMRSNVTRVQHTRSRQGRLRKMEKSTREETSASKHHYALPRLSSSDASTEPSTSHTHEYAMSSRSSQVEFSGDVPTTTRPARTVRHSEAMMMTPRAASFSTSLDKSVCHYCHKKFGIFRRRRVCDVCETVALCRKCGARAPSDVTVDSLRDSLGGRSPATTGDRPQVNTTKKSSTRERRPKTMCRECCAHAERFSTSLARPLR